MVNLKNNNEIESHDDDIGEENIKITINNESFDSINADLTRQL